MNVASHATFHSFCVSIPNLSVEGKRGKEIIVILTYRLTYFNIHLIFRSCCDCIRNLIESILWYFKALICLFPVCLRRKRNSNCIGFLSASQVFPCEKHRVLDIAVKFMVDVHLYTWCKNINRILQGKLKIKHIW